MMLTETHRFADQQGDRLLITASNDGDKPCWITAYPDVKIDDQVPSLPHSKKDGPVSAKHITLRPREKQKVYSAVSLFAYNSGNHKGNSISLALRGDDGTAIPYYGVVPKGPTQPFTWNQADVLNWSTEKPYNFCPGRRRRCWTDNSSPVSTVSWAGAGAGRGSFVGSG
ncbi:DUF4232 domain-containing protein [Streptomyces noursei]|uniref:DUF4232 domain-containing protein n=1 Tax=Streptomyces noursei TaxID=1971 RepID=UPI0023B860E9|nr:DUF4232 domain-containing protein [Streptomyces noursei]